jgi:hypothetical protein
MDSYNILVNKNALINNNVMALDLESQADAGAAPQHHRARCKA